MAINYFYEFKTPSSRNSSIDGLRGFLAVGVFIHHSSIWYAYIHTGIWEVPKSNFYAHLGGRSYVSFKKPGMELARKIRSKSR